MRVGTRDGTEGPSMIFGRGILDCLCGRDGKAILRAGKDEVRLWEGFQPHGRADEWRCRTEQEFAIGRARGWLFAKCQESTSKRAVLDGCKGITALSLMSVTIDMELFKVTYTIRSLSNPTRVATAPGYPRRYNTVCAQGLSALIASAVLSIWQRSLR
jgi:hypothetical protein